MFLFVLNKEYKRKGYITPADIVLYCILPILGPIAIILQLIMLINWEKEIYFGKK
jgi:hypothetical protein